ncbi:MAG: hypothetical protein KH696_09560 [Sutterella sp.]|nr:hypothetical protein [Sutterella sp.]
MLKAIRHQALREAWAARIASRVSIAFARAASAKSGPFPA